MTLGQSPTVLKQPSAYSAIASVYSSSAGNRQHMHILRGHHIWNITRRPVLVQATHTRAFCVLGHAQALSHLPKLNLVQSQRASGEGLVKF